MKKLLFVMLMLNFSHAWAQGKSYCFSTESISELVLASSDRDTSARAAGLVYLNVKDEFFNSHTIQMTRQALYDSSIAYKLSKLANDLNALKDKSNNFKKISDADKQFIESRYESLLLSLDSGSSHIYGMEKSGFDTHKDTLAAYRKMKSKWEFCGTNR